MDQGIAGGDVEDKALRPLVILLPRFTNSVQILDRGPSRPGNPVAIGPVSSGGGRAPGLVGPHQPFGSSSPRPFGGGLFSRIRSFFGA